MEAVFLYILRMSISAFWVIAAVLPVRLLLRRAPKGLLCALWLLPALRLCCPVFPEAWFSLLPERESAAISLLRAAPAGAEAAQVSRGAAAAVSPAVLPAALWLAGACLMLTYALFSWLRLRRTVAASLSPEPGIRLCDEAEGPFILGVFRPVIYLPSALGEPDRTHVLAHERAHLGRRDHRWKPLGWLILSLHWFNPLCWAAYILFCRDMEAACDEAVIRDLDRAGQAAYAQALLNCGAPRRRPAACPLAFGETGVKQRIRQILNYRKPVFRVILAAVILCGVLILCFLTDPDRFLPEDAEVKSAFFCSLIQSSDNTVEYIRLTPEQAEELRELLRGNSRRRSFYYGEMTLVPAAQDPDSRACSVDLNFTDGTVCQVLYACYRGNFLLGREDGYYARVFVYGRSRTTEWVMSRDFNEAFADWRAQIPDALPPGEAAEGQ